jgi:pimeloyl-ACP methyl ester carboxylesterase
VGGDRERIGATQGHASHSRRALIALRLAAPLLALAAGGCAYWTEKQGELIFRPTKDTWRGYANAQVAHDEHWIDVGKDGHRLHAWWLGAERPDAPSVLYLHGARWNLSGSVSRIDRWRKLGFNVLAIDYRGFGKSTDVSPSESLAYEDAEAAWDYLARLAPGHPRYIVGHSLGGAVAAELARRRSDANGVVLEATFTSVRDMIAVQAWGFLPVDLLVTQEFDTLKKIPEIKVPLLVVHGTRDAVVPYEMGERLYAAGKGKKRFIKVEGGSHHNLSYVGADEYRKALQELFAF